MGKMVISTKSTEMISQDRDYNKNAVNQIGIYCLTAKDAVYLFSGCTISTLHLGGTRLGFKTAS